MLPIKIVLVQRPGDLLHLTSFSKIFVSLFQILFEIHTYIDYFRFRQSSYNHM